MSVFSLLAQLLNGKNEQEEVIKSLGAQFLQIEDFDPDHQYFN